MRKSGLVLHFRSHSVGQIGAGVGRGKMRVRRWVGTRVVFTAMSSDRRAVHRYAFIECAETFQQYGKDVFCLPSMVPDVYERLEVGRPIQPSR